jgi:hypothetical protein
LAKAQSNEEQMRKRLQQLEKRSRKAESSLSLKQQQAHQKYQQNPDLLAAYKEGELTIVQELVKPTGISGSSTVEIIRGLLAVCEEHKAALEQLRSEHRADRSRQLRRLDLWVPLLLLLILSGSLSLSIIARTYQCNIWLESFALGWARFVITAVAAAAAASQRSGCLQLRQLVGLARADRAPKHTRQLQTSSTQ